MNPLAVAANAPTEVAAPTVAHAVAAALRRHEVDTIFGQSIPAALLVLAEQFQIRQIGYRTENAGGAMADGYARIAGKVGVVTGQNGPAATLLVAPLAEALKASVPLVVLVQDVALSTLDRNAFQEFDHFALFQSCAKWVRRLADPARVDDYIDMAFTAAASGRGGPAVLLLPMDLLRAPARPAAGATARSAQLGRFPLDRCAPGPEAIKTAARMLADAERPVIIAGGGIHLSGAADALTALSEAAAIPVATTNMGKGAVDECAPLSLGVFGNCTGPRTIGKLLRTFVAEADLVLLVGSRTNQNGTDSWTLTPHSARYIHLDADPLEIGRNYDALRLVGDARLTLELLTEEIGRQDLSLRTKARAGIVAVIAKGRAEMEAERSALGPGGENAIRPERLMAELDRILRPDDIVVADASYSTNWIMAFLTARKAGARFLAPRGLAGLGWGLPMAIGAKVARPEARVFALAGDGGFGHCWSELETARRMGVNLVLMVLNNGILGYQLHAENLHYGEHTGACEFAPVDHAAIARACGCWGKRVSHPDQIAQSLQEALDCGLPALLDVMTDPNAYPPLSLFGAKIPILAEAIQA